MERVEQKAKRVGKFNIVDIIAVILIVFIYEMHDPGFTVTFDAKGGTDGGDHDDCQSENGKQGDRMGQSITDALDAVQAAVVQTDLPASVFGHIVLSFILYRYSLPFSYPKYANNLNQNHLWYLLKAQKA